jgi:chromosome segregation ATPase
MDALRLTLAQHQHQQHDDHHRQGEAIASLWSWADQQKEQKQQQHENQQADITSVRDDIDALTRSSMTMAEQENQQHDDQQTNIAGLRDDLMSDILGLRDDLMKQRGSASLNLSDMKADHDALLLVVATQNDTIADLQTNIAGLRDDMRQQREQFETAINAVTHTAQVASVIMDRQHEKNETAITEVTKQRELIADLSEDMQTQRDEQNEQHETGIRAVTNQNELDHRSLCCAFDAHTEQTKATLAIHKAVVLKIVTLLTSLVPNEEGFEVIMPIPQQLDELKTSMDPFFQ